MGLVRCEEIAQNRRVQRAAVRAEGTRMGKDTQVSDTTVAFTERRPVGIGPVIAGWNGDQPVYYVDMVFADGSILRLSYPKRRKGADRAAKLSAINERMRLAKWLRPEVVLTHDEASFCGLVSLLSRMRAHPRAA